MQHHLEVQPDAAAVAKRGAVFVAERVREAISDHGTCHFAVSGGRTPWEMFAELSAERVDFEHVVIYQVDERVAPDGDDDRNLAHLRRSLGDAPATVVAMPVELDDLDRAARSYAALLPERFDLVHLGLGPDGHTASLVPGDPVLEVEDALVAVTDPYQGHRRMTLTYPALARAAQLLWLVTGPDKHDALARLLAGDTELPAGRVTATASLVLADQAAAPGEC